MIIMTVQDRYFYFLSVLLFLLHGCNSQDKKPDIIHTRERISINEDWQFMKYESAGEADSLIYDVRPEVIDTRDDKQADAKPTEAIEVEAKKTVLKPWIMPTGNAFIMDSSQHYKRPDEHPGKDFPFVQSGFDDSNWQSVDLPHDWAISGPFLEGPNAAVGGGMGRLPTPGVAWYRKLLEIPAADKGKSIFLDVDGAMSYAMVWLNGKLVGGWPFGYSSWRLNLTPYLKYGTTNQLAIRLDNPPNSSRWYPGGGIYRNVWLVKTNPVHVGQWGTFITTPEVSENSAKIDLTINIDNDGQDEVQVEVQTHVFELDEEGAKAAKPVASFEKQKTTIQANSQSRIHSKITLENPRLWGPPPTQQPNLYIAVTHILHEGESIDQYETRFGIRSILYDADKGLMVNGEHIYIKGVNQHHDLGALGVAFNYRAAQRQLEKLQELGANAIRMAHNPPAPELLELTDQMGFLVVDEMFDSWERKKTPLDFHLIFPEWHEQDLRALVRRDRNSPSVIMWSTGNEVGEQYTGEEGAEIARNLRVIVREEDPTRPTTASMNFAQADTQFPAATDVINLNYQGEGIRDAPAYVHLREGRISTSPAYPSFHNALPNKMIISSENAAALSSRGTYNFPVTSGMSSPVSDTTGGDSKNQYVSAYELYTADFGSAADKVFRSLDQHSYVAGGFVWSGWDYIGEPTPYYGARSSYYGIIDLAGFKKDRFYLYQSRWRPDLPIAHILPHWNWQDRKGKVTPVHVFTSGDAAELFLNGKSLGKKMKGEFKYRIRWDEVVYEPGELKVVAYREGEVWAEDIVKTTKEAAQLELKADRSTITADGKDLSFVTLKVLDESGLMVPDADNKVSFSLEGPGEIIATDNGDPTDMNPFPSHNRKAFNGLALVIVKAKKGETGTITIKVKSDGLEGAQIVINNN